MKEIDFLPSWYKKNRRQIRGYKWQYTTICVCVSFMIVWSFISGRIISTSGAFDESNNNASDTFEKYENYQQQLSALNEDRAMIEKYESKINVSNILAELSGLIDGRIVLSKIEIDSEEIENNDRPRTASVIRNNGSNDTKSFNEKALYKIDIKGVSADSQSVAQLICDLEESEYFTRVVPGYSKDVMLDKKQVTEFEISFYLANFKEVKQ